MEGGLFKGGVMLLCCARCSSHICLFQPDYLMALDVADAGVLKRNVICLLLKHPRGIKYENFSGAFYKLHGHHPQLAFHGYSSLKYLLTDMYNMVVLEKNPQATVIKLAVGASANCWLNKEKKMQIIMDEEAGKCMIC